MWYYTTTKKTQRRDYNKDYFNSFQYNNRLEYIDDKQLTRLIKKSNCYVNPVVGEVIHSISVNDNKIKITLSFSDEISFNMDDDNAEKLSALRKAKDKCIRQKQYGSIGDLDDQIKNIENKISTNISTGEKFYRTSTLIFHNEIKMDGVCYRYVDVVENKITRKEKNNGLNITVQLSSINMGSQ